ncbi:MAG: photosynthetic complex assembly protein [Nitrobacter sp.]|uniref:photosynthetic complex putative assembly protein PuhB n=1 Tax=Nitrobacter sp. TaxID=29420 RepID=UPI00387DD9E8
MSAAGRFEELCLPKGEHLIWQGRPEARSLALRVFHVRLVALYFALLLVARLAIGWSVGQPWLGAVAGTARLGLPLAVAMVLLGGLAFLYSRTTRYSLTNNRVLLQFGAVLPMTLNIPLKQVASAALREYDDGSGDLPFSVVSEQRLSYLLLWPHARPWRLNGVEPMLRCVPDARNVADLITAALAASSTPAPEPVVTALPAPQTVRLVPVVATAA